MTNRQCFFTMLLASPVWMSCSRNPSILLNTAGPHAEKTAALFWYMFGVEAVVGVLVLGFLFYSLWRQRVQIVASPFATSAQTQKRLVLGVATCIAITTLILTSFVVASYVVDRQLIDLDEKATVEIELTARQWWWEARYVDPVASDVFMTANEVHVPVGERVRFILKSSDVIHSLWFPNLSGKKDIIPGRNQDLFVRADREGTWQGRCAEFCGLQHAFMGIILVAESKEAYENWKKLQRLPAAQPQTPEERRGREIFTTSTCMMCHAIRGNDSTGYSDNAPDLTHLKSRSTIGAGAAPNTKGFLGGWILDPHGIKPGVHMPTILQESNDFQALLAYLEILK